MAAQKKDPYRFTVRFNSTRSGHDNALAYLNMVPQRQIADYLAKAIVFYERNKDSAGHSMASAPPPIEDIREQLHPPAEGSAKTSEVELPSDAFMSEIFDSLGFWKEK